MPPLYLGNDPDTKRPFFLPLERHALTIAGSGAGKGQGQIIPNLKHWPHSAVVIDPAGEAAEQTASIRAGKLGQEVAILDPFGYVRHKDVQGFRKSLNILSQVRSSDDLHMIADGIVKRGANEHSPHWNDSATEVIAGFLAYILEKAPAGERHIGTLRPLVQLVQRDIQKLPPIGKSFVIRKSKQEGEAFRIEEKSDPPPAERVENVLDEMASCTGFSGLAGASAERLRSGTNEVQSILSTVQTQTKWLTFESMAAWLKLPSEVDLRRLKSGRMTVYLVIPPDMLRVQGQFLRLFVRAAVSVMQERMPNGDYLATPCLMILDEFYSLGKMTEMQEAAAQMRKFGLHLWPFLQDWGQLVDLYGLHGAQGFVANADVRCVFGVSDQSTLEEISTWLGVIGPDEIEREAVALANRIENSEIWRKFGPLGGQGEYVQNQRLLIMMELLKSRIGTPRRTPYDIQRTLAKEPDGRLARRLFAFLSDGRTLELIPSNL